MRSAIILVSVFVSAAGVEGSQDSGFRFTVSVPTANVRERPSTESRVIAKLPRGTILDVASQAAGWIEVVLAEGKERRVGFVWESLGSVERVASRAASSSTPASTIPPAPVPTPSAPKDEGPPPSRPPAVPTTASGQKTTPIRSAPGPESPSARTLGVGGRVGGFALGMGGSVRLWSPGRLGLQVDVSRYSIGDRQSYAGVSVGAKYSVTQLGPSILYTFENPDPDEDVWLRPYIGGGLNLFRSTFSTTASGYGQTAKSSESATDVGIQFLGGAEAIFRRFPRLGISGDLGYYTTGTPFTGLQIGGFAYGLSVHWYVK
jgi:opacity protein-like surface antigen